MSRHNSWGWIRGFSRIAFGQSAARDSGLLLQGLKARLWGLGGLLEVKVRTGLHLLHIWQHPELHLTKLRVPPTSASLRAVFFTLLSAHNCTFKHFKQPNISWCNFSSKCIPEYSVTALQSQKSRAPVRRERRSHARSSHLGSLQSWAQVCPDLRGLKMAEMHL